MIHLKVYYKELPEPIFNSKISSLQQVQSKISQTYPEFSQGVVYIYHIQPITTFEQLSQQYKKLNISSIKVKAYPKDQFNRIKEEEKTKIQLQRQKNKAHSQRLAQMIQNLKPQQVKKQNLKGIIPRTYQSNQSKNIMRDSMQSQIHVGQNQFNGDRNCNIKSQNSQVYQFKKNNIYHMERESLTKQISFGTINQEQINHLKKQLKNFIKELIQNQPKNQKNNYQGISQSMIKSLIAENVKEQMEIIRNDLKFQLKQQIEEELGVNKHKQQLKLLKEQIRKLQKNQMIPENNRNNVNQLEIQERIKLMKESLLKETDDRIGKQINKIKYQIHCKTDDRGEQHMKQQLKQKIKQQILDQILKMNQISMEQTVKQQINHEINIKFQEYQQKIQQKLEHQLQILQKKYQTKQKIKKQMILQNQKKLNSIEQIQKRNKQSLILQPQLDERTQLEATPTFNKNHLQQGNTHNPLKGYRQQFEGFSTQQVQKRIEQQNTINNQNRQDKLLTQKKQQSKCVSAIDEINHLQIKVQQRNQMDSRSSIMDESSQLKKTEKSPKNNSKSKSKNKLKTLEEKRKQYSYEIVQMKQTVHEINKKYFNYTIIIKNNGIDWEDQLICMEKKIYGRRVPNKLGKLKTNQTTKISLTLLSARQIEEKQFEVGYKIKKSYDQEVFHQVGQSFKLNNNISQLSPNKQKKENPIKTNQFQQRIKRLIKYIEKKNKQPMPMNKIIQKLKQLGIKQQTSKNFNQQEFTEVLLNMHGIDK